MNVLFLDQYGELGGAQRCLLELIPAVQQRGWRAFAVVPGKGELAARLRHQGVEVREADVFRMPPVIRSWHRAAGFHLVYANGPRVLPAACLMPRALPLVFHAHSYLPSGTPRTIVRSCLQRRACTVIAISRFVASYVQNATVIPNGVPDIPPAQPRATTPCIGIVGRIAPEKGHLDFVQAVRLLPRNWRFLICGAPLIADPSYDAAVRREGNGLPIEFLGWRDDTAEVFQQLHLLVVPSGPNEGLGRVILEAFAACVPVVAYPSGGIPELIKDGITGYLVPERTPQALAARIRDVLSNPAATLAVTQNARTLYETNYTLAHYRERVTNVMAHAAIQVNTAARNNTGG